MFDNYPLTWNNSRFDILILHWYLWGGRFQMSVIKEHRVTGSNGRNLS